MRSLPRRLSAATAAALPAVVVAQQAADGAATGASGWNWIVGAAALAVVLALAWDLFGPARRGRRAPRAP